MAINVLDVSVSVETRESLAATVEHTANIAAVLESKSGLCIGAAAVLTGECMTLNSVFFFYQFYCH